MPENSPTNSTIIPTHKTQSLVDYFEIIIKNKFIVLRVMISTFIISVIVSILLPNIYISTARILPPQQDNNLLGMMMGQVGGGIASLATDILGKGTSSDLYASILTSEAIKDKVIDRFNLLEIYGKNNRLDTYKNLDRAVKIDVGKKDGIISISVEDKVPKRAADIANAYVEELGSLVSGLNVTGAAQDKHFIETQLIKTKADLSRSEDALKVFQAKNKALDISEQAKGTIKGIADISAQLAIEEVKLSTIRRQFTDKSQEVKVQKTVVNNLKSQISQLEGSDRGGVIPSVGSVPAISQEYIRLMRDFKTQEMIFELLTKQFEIAKFTEANSSSTVQIIQKATIPDKKSKPKRSILVLASTFGGFLFSIFYIFLLEYFKALPAEEQRRWTNIFDRIKFKRQSGQL